MNKKRRISKIYNGEEIWNAPNLLTLSRVILTFVIFYLIFTNSDMILIVIVFSIGMITDFLDGQIARRFDMTTEFGRKFDMIADRFLMAGTVFAIIINFMIFKNLQNNEMLQIFLILSREILTFPFVIMAFLARKGIVKVRFIGKLTTFMQGITFPTILLSVDYSFFSFSLYLAIATCIVGAISGIVYINDMSKMKRLK